MRARARLGALGWALAFHVALGLAPVARISLRFACPGRPDPLHPLLVFLYVGAGAGGHGAGAGGMGMEPGAGAGGMELEA